MMKNVIKNKDILMSKKVVELIIEGIVIFSVKSKANGKYILTLHKNIDNYSQRLKKKFLES